MQGYVISKLPHFDILSGQFGLGWWRSYVAAASRVFAGLVMLMSLPSVAAAHRAVIDHPVNWAGD